MASNQDSNKRVKVGLAIFAVLIAANILVHGSRMLRQPATITPAPIQTTSTIKTGAEIVPVAVTGSAISATSPDQYIEKQISELNQSLNQLKDRLNKVPEPLISPDLTIELVNSGYEFFKWQIESAPMVATPSIEQVHATPSGTTKIIGQFTIGGQTKLLVQTASTAFILNKEDSDINSEIDLLPQENDKYLIKDNSGRTQEIVEILTGGKKRTLYPVQNK